MPHRKRPCAVCPARRDNANNPEAKFPAERWAALTRTVCDGRGGSAPDGSPLFGCHKGAPGDPAEDILCAGWAAAFGNMSFPARLAAATGDLPRDVLNPDRAGWPDLYDDWAEMVAAQMWNPGDPDGHLPESLATRRRTSTITAEGLLKALPRMMSVRVRVPTPGAVQDAQEALAETRAEGKP